MNVGGSIAPWTAYRIRAPGAGCAAWMSLTAPGARIRYAVQGAVDPPTFTLFATARLPATYLRYVERKLREHFDLGPTPLKLRVRVGGR